MRAIPRKWRFFIAGGAAIVLLAWVGNFLESILLRRHENKETEEAFSTPHWRRFTNNELGYVVEFPSQPFETPNTLSNQNVISFRQFAATLEKHQVFMVATLVTSITNDYSEEQIEQLLDVTSWGVTNQGGQLLSQRKIKLGTILGKEVETIMPNGNYGKMRFYQAGHNLQEVVATTPPDQRESTNISYFMDSFGVIPR